MIYLDNGPVAKSRVFQNVMLALNIAWLTHVQAGKDDTRTTARSKGKVERPFRTVKEAHETLYDSHKPETKRQANDWLMRYLLRYNDQNHRSEKHSRLYDWLANLPADGVRDMCTWEQFCRFAREPERHKIGVDARITNNGTAYQVALHMAGETMVVLWGLFDDELYVGFDAEKFGTYRPVCGPIPLHRYRAFKLATLISALYCDLSQDKQVQIPKQGERCDCELMELVKKRKQPVAQFIDEAHDLNGHTLIGLKRLMDVVEHVGGQLSVILAGHPKLRNDLRWPTMEEIGYRTDIFNLDGIAGSQRGYIHWLLGVSIGNKTEPGDILTAEAIDMLATKLRTPLQVQLHLTLALEAGYQTGGKPVTAELVETVLSRQLNDLEPTLVRHGYRF